MAYYNKHRKEMTFEEAESEEAMKTQETRPTNRDYITLKNKIYKSKV